VTYGIGTKWTSLGFKRPTTFGTRLQNIPHNYQFLGMPFPRYSRKQSSEALI